MTDKISLIPFVTLPREDQRAILYSAGSPYTCNEVIFQFSECWSHIIFDVETGSFSFKFFLNEPYTEIAANYSQSDYEEDLREANRLREQELQDLKDCGIYETDKIFYNSFKKQDKQEQIETLQASGQIMKFKDREELYSLDNFWVVIERDSSGFILHLVPVDRQIIVKRFE